MNVSVDCIILRGDFVISNTAFTIWRRRVAHGIIAILGVLRFLCDCVVSLRYLYCGFVVCGIMGLI